MTTRSASRGLGPARRTVLVTGASGVVGRALVERLVAGPQPDATTDLDVVALVHRRPVDVPGVRSVHGDVTAPQLGLTDREYTGLTRRVDAVIHAAAVTTFRSRDGSLERTNVDGTAGMLQLAADASAPMYHVSTSFLHPTYDADRPRRSVAYAASKRAAERLVGASGLDVSVLRPSIVIGDSRTGVITDFQGIYRISSAVMQGLLPLLPFRPDSPLDFIPCDVVADGIARLVEQGVTRREVWLTAGDDALTMAQVVSVLVEHAGATGSPVDAPRFVAPDAYHRLIAPVFLDALPTPMRRAVSGLMDLFADYVTVDRPFPSSITALADVGMPPLPDSAQSLSRSLQYWTEMSGERDDAVA